MREIARIVDGIVSNVIVKPDGYEPQAGEVDVTDIEPRPGKGWAYDGVFTPPAYTIPSQEEAARNTILGLGLSVGLSPTGDSMPVTLDGWSALASKIVDLRAGALRETIGSPGYGQLTEYDQTLADARAFKDARAANPETDPTGYPMVAAEIDARAAATGQNPDPDAVAQEILDLCAAWYAALAAIKSTRRAAKLRIRAAGSVDEIATILEAVIWPEIDG